MSPVEEILQQIARLSPEDRAKVQESLQTRTMTIYEVSGEEMRRALDVFEPVRKQAESMTEEEIDLAIDEAITEVRAGKRAKRQHQS